MKFPCEEEIIIKAKDTNNDINDVQFRSNSDMKSMLLSIFDKIYEFFYKNLEIEGPKIRQNFVYYFSRRVSSVS